MPLLVSALIGGLIQALGTIVGRIMLSIGMGFIVYSGVDATLDYVKGVVIDNLTGMPVTIVTILSLCQVDTAVSILFSAVAVRLAIQGMQGGSFKRVAWK